VPQVFADVDRDKVLKQGVAVGDVYQTMQTFLGGLYVNQFNRFGRQWRVFLQAEGDERTTPERHRQFYVRNNDGTMVPLSALQTTTRTFGPSTPTGSTSIARAGHRRRGARLQLRPGDGRARGGRAQTLPPRDGLRLVRPVVPGEEASGTLGPTFACRSSSSS
jgi:hypothetical protein